MEDNLPFVTGNLGNWFLVCNIVSTQLDEICKTTYSFLKIEDYLNFSTMEDDLNFLKMEDDLIFLKMEDDLIFFENWRRPQKRAILTNSTAQHRQADQHNNRKYIGTIKKINLNQLWNNSKLT